MTTPLRLSPIHEALAEHGATWSTVAEMPVAIRFADSATEKSAAADLAICDASAMRGTTFKGPMAAQFLQSQAVSIPKAIFDVLPLANDGFIARTGSAEFFVNDGPAGDLIPRLSEAVKSTSGVYEVVRQDASFLISGGRAAEIFLQTCGYDFRQRPSQMIMTRVAGVSCSILAREFNQVPLYQLWLDGTYGHYLWETLVEIVHDSRGKVVGLAPFFPQLASQA